MIYQKFTRKRPLSLQFLIVMYHGTIYQNFLQINFLLLGPFSNAHLWNNKKLIESLKNVTPGEDEIISFDAVSLFTKVPLEPTLDFLKCKLVLLHADVRLSTCEKKIYR